MGCKKRAFDMYKTSRLPTESKYNHPPLQPIHPYVSTYARAHSPTHIQHFNHFYKSSLTSHTLLLILFSLCRFQSVATGGDTTRTEKPNSRGLWLGKHPQIIRLEITHDVILFYIPTQVKFCSDEGRSNETGSLTFICQTAPHPVTHKNANKSIN